MIIDSVNVYFLFYILELGYLLIFWYITKPRT